MEIVKNKHFRFYFSAVNEEKFVRKLDNLLYKSHVLKNFLFSSSIDEETNIYISSFFPEMN